MQRSKTLIADIVYLLCFLFLIILGPEKQDSYSLIYLGYFKFGSTFPTNRAGIDMVAWSLNYLF